MEDQNQVEGTSGSPKEAPIDNTTTIGAEEAVTEPAEPTAEEAVTEPAEPTAEEAVTEPAEEEDATVDDSTEDQTPEQDS